MQFTSPLRTLTKRVISRPMPIALVSSPRPLSTNNDFFCLGWDGRPLLDIVGKGEKGEQWWDEEEKNFETGDDRKYFEKHNPSPQLKVEFLLVRETVDDALRRAEEMWAAKVRGDPDSPQARVLARMLQERYNGKEHKVNIA